MKIDGQLLLKYCKVFTDCSCGLPCELVCPSNVIFADCHSGGSGSIHFDADQCTCCEVCRYECPEDAIRVEC